MNIGNERSTVGGQPLDPRDKIKKHPPITPEELQEFRSCTRGLILTAGLPFALCCSLLSAWLKKPEFTPPVLPKKGFFFLINVILGTSLTIPVCSEKVLSMRAENLKKNAELGDQKILPLEETKPVTQSEDLNYSSVLELGETQDNLSLDFTTPKLLIDDLDTKKPQSMTYEDLRARHRSGYGDRSSPLNIQTESPRRGTYSRAAENEVSTSPPPPQRIVKKNIYGDDTE